MESSRPVHDDEILGPAPVGAPPSANVADDEAVELVLGSFVTNVSPRDNLWLAATFRIPSGAHIYWQNPGESGLATEVRFDLPPSFRVGPTEYPGPQRFSAERGSVAYGYAGRVTLFAQLSTPADWTEPAEISAHATWLACSDVCVRASGSATHWLSPTDLAPGASAELRQQFSRLPQPLPSGPEPTRNLSPTELLLSTAAELTPLEYFPLAAFGHADRDCRSTPLGPGRMRITLGYETPPHDMRGVVLARAGDGEKYFSVDLGASTSDLSLHHR